MKALALIGAFLFELQEFYSIFSFLVYIFVSLFQDEVQIDICIFLITALYVVIRSRNEHAKYCF